MRILLNAQLASIYLNSRYQNRPILHPTTSSLHLWMSIFRFNFILHGTVPYIYIYIYIYILWQFLFFIFSIFTGMRFLLLSFTAAALRIPLSLAAFSWWTGQFIWPILDNFKVFFFLIFWVKHKTSLLNTSPREITLDQRPIQIQ